MYKRERERDIYTAFRVAGQIHTTLMACPTPNDVQAMSITESVLIPLCLVPDPPEESFRSRIYIRTTTE